MIRRCLCLAPLLLVACQEDSASSSDGASPSTRDGARPAKDVGRSGGKEAAVPAYDCDRRHPDWLLCDDFEGLSAGVDAWLPTSQWTEALGKGDAGRLAASSQAHGGKYALHMPHAAKSGYRGADLIWRACAGKNRAGCKPLKGHPRLYLRAWIRFAADHQRVHHFLAVGGGPIDDYWAPFGNAGCRPNGKRWMGTTVDFKASSHETFFYTYHPKMRCDPQASCARYNDPIKICAGCAKKGMPCDKGPECCWGNHFTPKPAVALPRGKWFCFEMMMKPNDVDRSNGEMAYWVGGKLGHRVTGMHWRDDAKLQMNLVRLQHYVTTSDAKSHSNQVWFDDVVISTSRVGCPSSP